MKKIDNNKRKRHIHVLFFTLILFLLYFMFNTDPSLTGMTFLAKVIDTNAVVEYNDSVLTLIVVIMSIFIVATGFILVPKYIKNIGLVLNVLGGIIFLVAIVDFFSGGLTARPISNFVIASFLIVYGLFILKRKVSI